MTDTGQPTPQIFDVGLSHHDIQALNSPDAVAAFFAQLHYHTEARTSQTPGNLGLTADGTVQPIKRIELIADQEGLFQIYLFELTSVTVTHTRALARAFRQRAGNYLLILTSDYEHLDVVLLEKFLPPSGGNGSALGQKQVSIRPRVLTVERRKPDPVHLRVLRRFTWTEPDPFTQYDKLLSAYSIADWSEEFFNNRALFSDYYLLKRLPEFSIWAEDPKPSYLGLRKLYQETSSRFKNKDKSILCPELIEPVLRELGFALEPGKKSGSLTAEPDYRLYSRGGGSKTRPDAELLRALCLAYPWDRSLDGKDSQRDNETPEENPGAVVVSLLERGEAPWVIVTNGKIWRLYAQRAHSRATNYYEIDLEEVLVQTGPYATDHAESFRYFWLLFRCQAFEPVQVERDGTERRLPFLDQLLVESEDYAKELGERLKGRVFEEIFPHLAAGFITYMRERDGLQTDISQAALDTVFQGTLTLLYRLLFLLYAESRDLLPVKETRGYFEASLKKLKDEVSKAAGNIADKVEERLRRGGFQTHPTSIRPSPQEGGFQTRPYREDLRRGGFQTRPYREDLRRGGFQTRPYREDRYELYDRLIQLFQVVDKGHAELNVPVYNGGLFLSDPDDEDESAEAQTARFLNTNKVPDLFLARAIDLLARDEDPKRDELVPIDYKSLGVRQLGSIYEGLLEFKLRMADQKLGIVKRKDREVYVPFKDLDKREQERVERQKRVVKKGGLYLENDKRERKATGSYYTPDHIVKYIVEHAVGPVLQEKFDAMRTKLRDAQRWHREMTALAKAKGEPESKYESGPAVEQKWSGLVDELFNLKVLDPAMGSGHFLVEAVDYITDKAIDFLNAFPWNPVRAHLSQMRETILQAMDDQGIIIDDKRLTDVNLLKRHVLKRCIYGVDLNPMAVELAKVSLWLDCFTLGAPLSFLDHHLRCGNSLIGVTVDKVKQAIQTGQLSLLSGTRFEGIKQAVTGMIHIGELSDVTAAQVRESRTEYKKASDALKPAKRLLDVYTSQWFGNTPIISGRGKKRRERNRALEFLRDGISERWAHDPENTSLPAEWKDIVSIALQAAKEKRFLHWELEFPEVFYRARPGSIAIERLEDAGFDAVIGNPPYDVLASEELGYDVSQDLTFYETTPLYEPAIRGKKNLYKLFICRGATLADAAGTFGVIVPMALLGDDQAAAVRRWLLKNTSPIAVEAFPQKDDPRNRVFPEAKLSTAVFVAGAKFTGTRFAVRTHAGRLIAETSPALHVASQEVIQFDPNNTSILTCTQHDWEIATKINNYKSLKRLGEYCLAFQGEVNETTDGKKGFISTDHNDGPQILRGANICLYTVREGSQGEAIYLRKEKYLEGKPDSLRAHHHKQRRIGWQESSPQNNFRRIIAAPIPENQFCNHKINYIPEDDSQLSLDFVLALLNGKSSDWFFRLASTNAAVSHYQIYNLPCPTVIEHNGSNEWNELLKQAQWNQLGDILCAACTEPGVMPKPVAEALAEMSRRIQQIEAKRVLKSRSERSRLAPESQPIQDAIDAVLFRCYGLSDDDARYINKRLEEML